MEITEQLWRFLRKLSKDMKKQGYYIVIIEETTNAWKVYDTEYKIVKVPISMSINELIDKIEEGFP